MRDHRLAPFWAPFLLLHLGGPDNITAYSLEDNKLWKRHLLTLVVQVLGAGYVLYMHVSRSSGAIFSLVAAFMTGVGVVKFWERTWALKRARFSSIRSSVKTEAPPKCDIHLLEEGDPAEFKGRVVVGDEEEFLMRRAHYLFHVCKSAMVDSSVDTDAADHHASIVMLKEFKHEEITRVWALMEMELSLVYDILYTKAAMVHTLAGYCVRVISPVAAAASLLIFYFVVGGDDSHRVDVAVTYVLLVGALLMETASLVTALLSTWTFAFLCYTRWSGLRHAALCSGRWERLRRVVVALRRLAYATGIGDYFRLSQSWSGTIGQYNMLDMCVRRWDADQLCDNLSWRSPPLLNRWARRMLLGSRTWTVDVPERVKENVVEYIKGIIRDGEINTLGVIRKHWCETVLERWRDRNETVSISHHHIGAELQEAIIMWHIGTDIFLAWRDQLRKTEVADVEAIKALSNYMMFLLVKLPGMLPGLAQNKLYERTETSLATEWSKAAESSQQARSSSRMNNSDSRLQQREKLANSLHDHTPPLDVDHPENSRLIYGIRLAKDLLKITPTDDALTLVFEVWTDILIYTANRCSREAHAKKLNSGGELTTIIWLLTEHLHQGHYYRARST
ncbi:hypothetical protein EJB05_00396, partial [Eragrostis curvula]